MTTATVDAAIPLRPVDREVLLDIVCERMPRVDEETTLIDDAENLEIQAGKCRTCARLLDVVRTRSVEPAEVSFTLGALRLARGRQERRVSDEREEGGLSVDVADAEADLANTRALITALGGDTPPFAGDDA